MLWKLWKIVCVLWSNVRIDGAQARGPRGNLYSLLVKVSSSGHTRMNIWQTYIICWEITTATGLYKQRETGMPKCTGSSVRMRRFLKEYASLLDAEEILIKHYLRRMEMSGRRISFLLDWPRLIGPILLGMLCQCHNLKVLSSLECGFCLRNFAWTGQSTIENTPGLLGSKTAPELLVLKGWHWWLDFLWKMLSKFNSWWILYPSPYIVQCHNLKLTFVVRTKLLFASLRMNRSIKRGEHPWTPLSSLAADSSNETLPELFV